MASCVRTLTNGNLRIDNTQLPETCPQFVVLDSGEFNAYQNLVSGTANTISLQDIFQIPDSSQLGLAFGMFFGMVMVTHIAAWGYGVVINFFKPEHERY